MSICKLDTQEGLNPRLEGVTVWNLAAFANQQVVHGAVGRCPTEPGRRPRSPVDLSALRRHADLHLAFKHDLLPILTTDNHE